MEVAVSLDPTGSGDFPQPFAVVSVGLRSLDGALEFIRKEGEPVRQIRAGVYRVGSGRSPSCAVAASVGAAPARLVCGDRAEDVDALLPYATRGLPNENLGASDLHLEVRAEPLRRRYARELRQLKTLATPFVLREISMDDPRFDRALADTVHALADEVLAVAEDVDTLTLDASVHGQKGVIDGDMAMKFRASSSWTAQSLLEVQKRSGTPGELFWRLPGDSAAGTYSVGVDSKRYQGMRRTLAELLDGFLAHESVPRRVRDQLTELVEQAWVTDAGSVYARGDLPPGDAALTGPARMRQSMKEGFGWHVLGIAESSKKFTSALDKAVKVYNDPQLRKLLKKRAHVDAKELPTLKTRRAGRGLPAGSKVYELTLPGEMFKEWAFDAKGKDKSKIGKPLPFVVIVVPDGDRTWIGASGDEKLLIEKLAVAKAGDTKNTLASKEGLGATARQEGRVGRVLHADGIPRQHALERAPERHDVRKGRRACTECHASPWRDPHAAEHHRGGRCGPDPALAHDGTEGGGGGHRGPGAGDGRRRHAHGGASAHDGARAAPARSLIPSPKTGPRGGAHVTRVVGCMSCTDT